VRPNRCDDMLRLIDEARGAYDRDNQVLAASANFADIGPKNRD
jgi:hypothetical protein